MSVGSRTIAVTGATGFVCANVVNYLAGQGHTVLACDISPPPEPLREAWTTYGRRVLYVEMDVTLDEGWRLLDATAVDAIIHGAAVTPGGDDPDPLRTARVNLFGTIAGLEYARRRTGARFVNVSSSGVYGATIASRPLRETRAVHPPDSYCLAKYAAEKYVTLYRGMYGVDACSGRVAAPYGPWDRPTWASHGQSPVYYLAAAALGGKACRIIGSEAARDWTYAEDTAAGLGCLALVPEIPYDVFNVSSGQPASLKAIAEITAGLVPGARFVTDQVHAAQSSVGPIERRSPLSIRRLMSIGFKPRVGLQEGVARYIEWLKREGAFTLLS